MPPLPSAINPVLGSEAPKIRSVKPLQALKGIRILSLALNLPGPAALMRCRAMGATCRKLEPPLLPLHWLIR